MIRKAAWLFLLIAALVLAAILLRSEPGRQPQPDSRSANAKGPKPDSPMKSDASAEPEGVEAKSLQSPMERAAAALRELQTLPANQRPSRASEILRRLREALASGDLSAAVAAIISFLNTGADAPSGLPFQVAEGGSLDSAPTLRAFLLDFLGTLDPIAAADYSRRYLAAPPSMPDETALAMRNLAWGSGLNLGEGDRALVQRNLLALLNNDAWRTNPSAGYLEGLDAAVFLADSNLTSRLAQVVAGRDATSPAALLALDRIAQSGDPALLRAISDPASPLGSQPAFRAELMARAEISDPAQREVVAAYLTDPAVTPDEKRIFLETVPLRSQTEGPRLITEPPPVSNLPELDRGAMEVLRTWQGDPAFKSVQPGISAAIQRIQEYLR